MNLKNFLTALFRRPSSNGEIDTAHEAGKRDADLLIAAYADGFESEASRILSERQQRFLGYDAVEAEYEIEPKPLTAAELKGLRKPELLELADRRGHAVDESWTVAELREELAR